MAKFDGFFLVILSWLDLCHALDFQTRSSRQPIEVHIVSFGIPGGNVFESIPQLTISGPSYSLAADELNRRYNQTFHFTYVNSGSASCLSSPRLQHSVDVLADFYYKAWRPGRIFLFVVPGVEAGKMETEWKRLHTLRADHILAHILKKRSSSSVVPIETIQPVGDRQNTRLSFSCQTNRHPVAFTKLFYTNRWK